MMNFAAIAIEHGAACRGEFYMKMKKFQQKMTILLLKSYDSSTENL